MLIKAAEHGWMRGDIPGVTVTGVLQHTFPSPVMIYRITGVGSVKVSADEATVIYDGLLPYDFPEPIACDSLIFETPVTGTETAEDGTIINTYATVELEFLGVVEHFPCRIRDYFNTSSGMKSVAGSVDDAVYSVATGITGFKFNGSTISTLYVSTNHFVGFGSSTEHLKIFRRDGRSTAIYSQVVTDDGIPFIKIRFEGYTVYSNQITANRLIYELFLIGNGDMFLHIIQAPTTSGTYGSSSLTCGSTTTTLNIPANGTAGTVISFRRADSNGSAWDIAYEAYGATPEDIPLYLMEVDGKYYAAVDGALSETPAAELTALAFLEHGSETLPTAELIPDNPKIYAWTAVHSTRLKWSATANPLPQELTCTVDLSHESILGISLLAAEYSGTVELCHRVTGGSWSDPVLLNDWIARDCAELWESLGDDRLLYLKFVLHGGAIFTRFKITLKN